jgi:tetratricopeptide (TPR) repeat protein
MKKISLIVFGIALALVVIELGLRVGAGIVRYLQESRNAVSCRRHGSYRILCIGESTTAGSKEAYPAQLEEILNARKAGIEFSVINRGWGGATTGQIVGRLEQDIETYKPDMIISMLGVNDGFPCLTDPSSDSPLLVLVHQLRIYRLITVMRMRVQASFEKAAVDKSSPRNDHQPPPPIHLPKFRRTRIIPEQDDPRIKSGRGYARDGEFAKAEAAFKEAAAANPHDDNAYVELAHVYRSLCDRVRTAEALKKAIEINPSNSQAYAELAWNYIACAQNGAAEKTFKQNVAINPGDYRAYFELARFYAWGKDYGSAIAPYRQALALYTWFGPTDLVEEQIYRELAWAYYYLGEYGKTEEMLAQAIERYPQLDKARNSLALVQREKHGGRFRAVSPQYQPETIRNFARLKEIADRKGVRLVCMQYPMCSVEALRQVFKERRGIVFVDNQGVFEKAVRKGSYKAYFSDMFAGEFGHCTDRGNRLLAENAARVLLQEIFHAAPASASDNPS